MNDPVSKTFQAVDSVAQEHAGYEAIRLNTDEAKSALQPTPEVHPDKFAVTEGYSKCAGQPTLRVTVIEDCPEIPCAKPSENNEQTKG
jgi:hypothetical protein